MSGPTRIPGETVTIGAPRGRLWALLDDPAALQRVLPGCEALRADGPDRYMAVLATRAGFMVVRADATVELQDVDRPSSLRLVIAGRPRGIGGEFHVAVPIELEELGARLTSVTYEVALELSGRIASLGGALVGSALHGQVTDLIRNVERELSDHPGQGR